ncbi:Yos1-like protein [Microthyrium microscopicum]|uniref:Yos1-like protein n=1 Tax=Microthyrium microscopicum TaxID=703497 RepID=A0A6A6USU1_9PEZI|nr:Yos1-like protein [Microthyrium microscopicum]
MFFGFGNIILVGLLLVNAIAVLSEDRFLARIGWSTTVQESSFGGAQDNQSVKAKLVNLIASVRTLLRIPLIILNTVVVIYLIILG